MPLSDERLLESNIFNRKHNTEEPKTLIEKLGNQCTASINDVMEQVCRVHVMHGSRNQPMSTTIKKVEGKQKAGAVVAVMSRVLCMW
jgi:hypothetical protein